ncbi:DegT/DnrJ/EryC1/StrS family aminotransferase [Yeosuana marina]|uniref:DegT/DnrJ/EryC1/StrS family aminotransferase n=1 Tax=Yeosuana marina TaxID=1565536 RepID=UPI001424A605|nr:DegT/DnrJ/EryC1/StrS family aminotransferase [Yeosuana marina]
MIKFLDLKAVNKRYENDLKKAFNNFLNSGQYILGQQVLEFERSFAKYCGTNYCIGVSNGLDGLTLIFKAYMALGKLKEGDSVIVAANTYIASILAIINAGLKPVLVEPSPNTFNIDSKEIRKYISDKTKAILVVHLYGQLCEMKSITELSKQHDLLIVEDAAQAHGAFDSQLNKKAGNLSHAAAFSFYPTKNLGALGDAGAITTNNKVLAETISKLRNYGRISKYKNDIQGVNNRLDEIQSVFLNIKLPYLDLENAKRRIIAKRYLDNINNKKIVLPYWDGTENHVFHVFVIRTEYRKELQDYLLKNKIQTLIFYPIAPHKQEALKEWHDLSFPITENIHDQVLSIPINPYMKDDEVEKIIKVLNKYECFY